MTQSLKPIGNLFFEILLMVVFGLAMWEAYGWPSETRFFPVVVGFLCLGMTALLFVRDLIGYRRLRAAEAAGTAPEPVSPGEDDDLTEGTARRALGEFVWLGAVTVLAFLLGFYPAVFVYLAAFLKKRAKMGWVGAVVFAAVTTAIVYAIFVLLLETRPYLGLLGELLK